MDNKQAIEFFAALFETGLAVASTNNIRGREVKNAFTCSHFDGSTGLGLNITCWGTGAFEARLVHRGHQLVLLTDPEKVGFEELCKSFKCAYDNLKGQLL